MTATEKGYLRRDQMMRFIQEYISTHGYSPSVREVRDFMGYQSTSVAFLQLRRLRQDGYVTFIDSRARTVRLTERGNDHINHRPT